MTTTRAGKPVCAWDDPDAKTRWSPGWSTTPGRSSPPSTESSSTDEQADAVGLLALVAGQDVEPGDDEGTWRIAQRVAPDRVISTVDPDTRHMHKTVSEYRDGYKAHIAVEPDTGLITAAALTPANAGDGPTGVALLAGEKPGLQVLADSAYGSGEVRAALRRRRHRAKRSKRSRCGAPCPGGFDRDDFIVDHDARTATCPAGHAVHHRPQRQRHLRRHAATAARYATAAPPPKPAAPSTSANTTPNSSKPATRGATATSPIDYRQRRPMVERSIAWLVARGHRRVRYRGVERNHLGLAHRVAAINLRRLVNLGLNHNGHAGPSPEQRARELTKRERHLRASKPTRATGSHPRTPALRSVMTPDPTPAYEQRRRESALFNSLLVAGVLIGGGAIALGMAVGAGVGVAIGAAMDARARNRPT